ncbi:MAG TPA: DUF4186 family protein [Bacteroidia bacterium]|nr:DUF4186 family protein [Bacteroidia bacterium]
MTKFKRVPAEVSVNSLTPLNITCGSSKCSDNLHCFHMSKADVKKHGTSGVCKECGSDLIDWKRIHKNNLKDVKFTFKAMKHELIRHVFWHTPIEKKAIENASKLNPVQMKERAKKLINQKIGKSNNFREGYQTAKVGNEIVNYAQHATATCCRKCLEYWHNIPMGTNLNEDQLEYCADLAMLYIQDRLKDHSSKLAK